ncbi:MAG TPA: hypothetical protein VLE73_02905 [Candidatus Saccharimonadales bacterium]|nr:hypothetical protein [Candidatus Saccharimonadales bacterium]
MAKKSYETVTDTLTDVLGMFALVFSGAVVVDALTDGTISDLI